MTSLDVFFAVTELRNLIGGQIQKVYQQCKAVWLEVYVPAKGSFTLRFEPGKLFITDYRRAAPEQPEGFAMFCRKHIQGQQITDVRQHGFDRIVEVETERAIIIFELFSKGNVIICNKENTILMPLDVQLWKDRQVVPRKPYRYPPEVLEPFKINQENLREMLNKNDKDIVRFLAVDLSLSGLYAEEICLRAQVDKNKPCKNIDDDELLTIYEAMHSLLKQFSPHLIFEGSTIVDAVPFDMLTHKNKRVEKIQTFLHALDEAYTRESVSETELGKAKVVSNQIGKFERIAEEQKAAIERLKKQTEDSRLKAEVISRNAGLVEQTISDMKAARDAGQSWAEIKKQVRAPVKEIQERKGKIILNLA
jgi:predicted ribosome quality control (RQC) complex YloA/Tae2 family protein